MPKQLMRVKNKQHHGPQSPRVASNKQCAHAFWRGAQAWNLYNKPISSCPYRPGLENDAWRKGYLQACDYKYKPIENKAPEGAARHKDSYVVAKRTGAVRRAKGESIPREQKPNNYLGYIKPGKNGKLRRFFVWSNNPQEDKWKNKVACKSYKEESE